MKTKLFKRRYGVLSEIQKNENNFQKVYNLMFLLRRSVFIGLSMFYIET